MEDLFHRPHPFHGFAENPVVAHSLCSLLCLYSLHSHPGIFSALRENGVSTLVILVNKYEYKILVCHETTIKTKHAKS